MENKQVAKKEEKQVVKSISENVMEKIKELEAKKEISFPKNYNYANALKSAQLILAQTLDNNKVCVLESCTKNSIINALFDMTLQGLSPSKKQCYFVPFGGKLTLMVSVFGKVAAVKRLAGVKNVFSNLIYKDDIFEYAMDLENGVKKVTKHEQCFKNLDNTNIVGAYCVITFSDGSPSYMEVMNIGQIRFSWEMGQAKGVGKTHNKFTDEMCLKTVTTRACKRFINTSDDSNLVVDAILRTDDYREEDIIEVTRQDAAQEIEEKANKVVIDIEVPQNEEVIVEAEVVEVSNDEPQF